jgi:hypothetical protein
MAKIPYIRTLQGIAVGIRDLAIKRAPKDTGHLKKMIYSYNTPVKDKMIKQLNDLSVVIELTYAPPTAEYGQWFNDPPSVASKRRRSLKKTAIRRGNWNYALDAIDDDALNAKFDEYLKLLGDYVVEDIEANLDL